MLDVLMVVSILIMLMVAVFLDLKSGKIPNAFNGLWIVYGLVYRLIVYGCKGVLMGMVGVLIPIIGLMVLFAFRIIGAGDIKLFAGLGAFLGLGILKVVIYSFILCGIFGVILLVIRLVKCLVRGDLKQGIVRVLTHDRQYTKVAFSVFILGGFVWCLLEGGVKFGV